MEREDQSKRIAWDIVLNKGLENAVSMEELRQRLNMGTTRTVRAAVMQARLSGIPVCAIQKDKKNTGYFLPDPSHPEEVTHTINEMRKRGYTALKEAASMNQWLRDNTGDERRFEQMSIQEFLKEEEARGI